MQAHFAKAHGREQSLNIKQPSSLGSSMVTHTDSKVRFSRLAYDLELLGVYKIKLSVTVRMT